MSDTNNTSQEPQEQSLDDFAADFFGEKQAQPEPANSEEPTEEEVEEPSAQPDEGDTSTQTPEEDSDEDDALEEADEDDEDDEEEEGDDGESADDDPEPKPKPKKQSRAQKRIEELNAKYREEERQRIALEQRIAELERGSKQDDPKPAEKQDEGVRTAAPDPNAKNEDGSDKYPLGDMDPNFMKDTLQHMLDEREAAQKAEAERVQKEREAQTERGQLQEEWNEKLVDARERYPDFQEKGEQMLSVFEGIDENYGEYLTSTIMSMDNGPDVFYHLANNIDEAQRIVSAGPRKATIELGKLEASLTRSEEPKPKARPKVSKAAPPPPRNRGSSVAKPAIPGDTDDLAAFEQTFFKPK